MAVKTVEQRDIQAVHRDRASLIGERTAKANQLRGLSMSTDGPDYLTVHHSKTGTSRRLPLNPEGIRMFLAAIAGRDSKDTVLTQSSGEAWTAIRVSRSLRRTCEAAKIEPPIQFLQLAHDIWVTAPECGRTP